MCRIIQENVKNPFVVNDKRLGDLVVHSPQTYTWETEDRGLAVLVREDGEEEIRGYITFTGAIELAGRRGIPVKFDDPDYEDGPRIGTAHPCGCLDFSTILSDGSLGWGGWSDPCWDHMNE